MSIRFNMLANSYGLRDVYKPSRDAVEVMYRNKDYFASPDYEKRYLRTKSDYENILALARDTYLGEEDPTSYENRIALGKIISSIYPGVDPGYAADNIEDLMYYATGYRPNVDSLAENFVNTFHSAGSSMLASYKMALLYLGGALDGGFDNEDFQARKAQAMADLKRYAKDYRPELADYSNPISNVISPLAIGAAQILPSMLPSLTISGAMALASMIPGLGGVAIPATTIAIIKGIKSGTMLGRQAVMGGINIGSRWAATALMEMGGSAMEMAEAGFDDDIIFNTSVVVGALNGIFETVGDKAVDTALRPLREALKGATKDQVNNILHKTVRSMIRDWGKDTALSVASESATETMQEFSTMFGYNFAVALQEERGKLPEGVRKYTREDFGEAFKETIKQTALGTLGLSLGTGAARVISQSARPNSEFRRIFNSNKYTTTEGMNARIRTSDITGMDNISTEGINEDNFSPTAPIKVVRVGDKFRAVSPTKEQAYAKKNGRYVNAEVVDMSTESAIGTAVTEESSDMHRGMTLDSINATISVGLDNDAIEGFTYYDSEMNPTTPSSDISYASIKAKDSDNPIVIPVTEDNTQTRNDFEAAVFGETFTKEREQEPKKAKAADTAQSSDEETRASEDFTDDDLGLYSEEISDMESAPVDETISKEAISDADTIAEEIDDAIDDDLFPEASIIDEMDSVQALETDATAQETVVNEDVDETVQIQQEETQQSTGIDEAQKRADADTARRLDEANARNEAHNEWEDIKRQLTGNRGEDVDTIANHFKERLKNTAIGKNDKVLDAMSKASAEIMVGFAKASGLTGNDYYNTIQGFLYGIKAPDGAYKSDIDNTIFAGSAYEARMMLKLIQGSSIVNEDDGSIARISSTSIGKLLSNKALNKSLNNGFTRTEHDTAAANIDTLFRKSIKTSSREDRKGSEHIVGIHYYSTDIAFQDTGREGTAEIMVKESVQNGQLIYTMELVGLKTRDPLASRMGNQSEDQLARSQGLSVVILPSSPRPSNSFVLGSRNPDGSYMGWFNPDSLDRYISIMESAEPTTLIHELGHHFLSVLAPDNPAYILITNVYGKQFDKDGGTIGESVQEAFAKDLEKYVFLRKSSNKRLNGIFQTLYNVASSLWKTLKSTVRLSAEKKAMFDAIFYEEESASDTSTVKADVRADNSPTPIINIVENSIKETAEPASVEEVSDSVKADVDTIQQETIDTEAELDIAVDTEETADTEKPAEDEKIVSAIQTTEEMTLNEKPVEYAVIDKGENFAMREDFIDELDDTDGKALSSIMKEGTADSKTITSQIKAILNGRKESEYLEEVNDNQVVRDPVVKMETRSGVYKNISGLMGVEGFDANAAEFFYGEDGSVYVKLKKDIRTRNGEKFLLDKRVPRWFRIPLQSDDTISVLEALEAWYGNNYLSKDYDIDYEEFIDEFKGWSKTEIPAIAFAYVYDLASAADEEGKRLKGYPKILFSADDSEMRNNLRSYARNTMRVIGNDALFNTYSRFKKLYDETASKGDDALAEVFGSYGSEDALFASYLEQHANDLNLSDEISALDADQKAIFFEELAEAFIITSKSYTAIAHVLKDGVKNEKKYNTAVNLLKGMVRATRLGSNKRTSNNEISELLRGKAITAWDNVWRAFSTEKNTASVSKNDVIDLINALVDDDYSVSNLKFNADGSYTSPLMVLANYYAGYQDGKDSTSDSFAYAGDDYVSLSKGILEGKQSVLDAFEGDLPRAFKRLRDIIKGASENKNLKSLMTKALSYDYSNALVERMNDIINDYRNKVDSKEITPEIRAEIDRLVSKNKELSDAVSKLRKASEKSGNNAEALKAELNTLRKDNKEMARMLDSLGGADNIADISSYISQLERKVSNLDKKIADLKENGTARERYWKRKVEIMQNQPAYMTAQRLKEAWDNVYNSIDNEIRSGKNDSRVSAQLALITNALNGKKGSKINPSIFESSFQGYEGWFDPIMQFCEDSGMIVDGKLERRLKALTYDDVSKFAQLVYDVSERGMELKNEKKTAKEKLWRDAQNEIIRSLDILETKDIDDAELASRIKELRNMMGDGENVGLARDLISKFRVIELQLREINPTLHDIIFRGRAAGLILPNINDASNQRIEFTNKRKSNVSKKFEEIFGENAKNFGLAFDRFFVKPKSKLGVMSAEEYAAKHGISWGTISKRGNGFKVNINESLDPSLKPLAARILNVQKAIRNNLASATPDVEANTNLNRILTMSRPQDFSVQQMMGIYLLSKQTDGLRRLIVDPSNAANTNRLSIGNILWVLDQFENNSEYAKYREFADYLAEEVGSRYQEISDTYYNQTGKLLPRFANYFPIRDMLPSTEKQLKDQGGFTKEGSIRANFIHERTGSMSAADLDAVSVAIRTIEDQENYIAFQEVFDELGKMFEAKSDLSAMMRYKYGTKGDALMDNLRQFNDAVANATQNRMDNFSKAMRLIRGNLAQSVLWGNLSTLLQQIPTFLLVARDVGLPRAMSALTYYMSNRKEVLELMNKIAPQMIDRQRLDVANYRAIATKPMFESIHKALMEKDPNNIYLKSRETYQKAIRAGMGLIQAMDSNISNAMWLAEYRMLLDSMKSDPNTKGMSQDEYNQYVANVATQNILSMISSSAAKDNALAYSVGNEAVRTLLQFTSQLNKQYNMIVNAFQRMRNEGFNAETFKFLGNTVLYVGLATMGAAFISGKALPDEDDDDWWDNILGSTIGESLGMIPGGNDLKAAFTGEIYYDTGLPGAVANFISAVRKGEDRREGQMGRATMNLITGIGEIIGMPTSPIRRLYNATSDDDMDFNWGELINSETGDFVRMVS